MTVILPLFSFNNHIILVFNSGLKMLILTSSEMGANITLCRDRGHGESADFSDSFFT